MAVAPIPEGFHSVTPYLIVADVVGLIDFLKAAFGAEEIMRMPGPDGKVVHAQVRVGDSKVMMGPSMGEQWKPLPAGLYHYVADVDAVFQRAVAAGGTVVNPVADTFYGDRVGAVKDPAGNYWWIASCKEKLSVADLQARMQKMFAKPSAAGK